MRLIWQKKQQHFCVIGVSSEHVMQRVKQLDSIVPFEKGFPFNFFVSDVSLWRGE